MKKLQLLVTFIMLPLFIYSQTSLVAYYPFNGNANDISGNANNGTVNGATLTTDRFGNTNSAYYFDGTNNYISIADNSNINIQTGESFSISFWAKHDAQNNAIYMISKYKGSFGEPSYSIGTGSYGDSYSWFEFTPSNGIENRGTIDLNDNNWHNITTVFKSGESVTIYVDGVLDISKGITYTGSIINTRNLTIGCGSNLTQFYKGSIDDVKIYKKALTLEEIKNEVNGLVAYYPFNGNANDESGNGNNGTVNGATLTTDRFGNVNSAYHFNGTDNYIQCLFPGPLEATSRTISFWAKTDAVPTSNYGNVVLSYGITTTSFDYGARFDIELNSKAYGLGCGLGGGELTKAFDNSDNNWHFYTVVFDNTLGSNLSDILFYADGNLLTTNAAFNGVDPVIHTSSQFPIYIGMLYGYGRYFKGDIDDIKIYNKALTETEIKSKFKTLIAYYPFNGNANDESGNGNNGTVNGATLTTDRFGNANSAYHFNGVDNDITCIYPGPIGESERTISFWAKTSDVATGTYDNAIISYGSNTIYGQRFEIDVNSQTRGLGIDINGAALTKDFDNSNNDWHFYAAVFDGGTNKTMYDVKLYADGNLLTTNTFEIDNGAILNTSSEIPIHIGSLFNTYRFFNGDIDEVKFYNKALTETEIKSEFKTLIAYYPFNGNANDESGNNLNGTVSGATLTTDRFGNPDSAYSFDGSDIITVAHNDILNCSNELSISVWVKPNSLQNAMILGKSNYTSATNYLLRTKSTGYIAFEYKDFANSNSLPLNANVWNHIAVISKSDNSKQVYINGVLATHTSATSPFGLVTNALTIGARSGAEFFNGSIDDLRIYSMALTEAQISSLFTNNTLAVNKVELKTNLSFYVHNNIFYFNNTQNLSEVKNIEVYNLLGQKVYKTSKIEKQIPITNLQKGIYILKVEDKNSNYNTLKFISY